MSESPIPQCASAPSARPPRAQFLDLFKTLLVWGMVMTHIIQLLTFGRTPWANSFAEFINLLTFSGFMLAFGLGIGLSATRHHTPSLFARLRGPALLLLALWVSSFAYVVLVEEQKLNPDLILDILPARRLFGWSEFLASFFVLAILTSIARPALVWIATRPPILVLAIGACLASTGITIESEIPFLSAIVGTWAHASFPVLAYLPWFLIGIAYGAGRAGGWLLGAIALLATSLYFGPLIDPETLRNRFPPELLWIVGPAAFLWLYLAASKALAARTNIPKILLTPGRHVLGFLLLSNLAIFALRFFANRPIREDWQIPALTLALMAAITVIFALWDSRRGRVFSGKEETTFPVRKHDQSRT